MKRMVITCDRCGKEIPDENSVYKVLTDDLEGVDLCDDCKKEFGRFLKNQLKSEPAQAPARPVIQKLKIQKNMEVVYALRKVGWNFAKVSDVFGVSTQTIVNWIAKDKEEQRKEKEGA